MFFAITAFAQDVIITRSGEQIRAKIIEVTENNISYKKFHDQEGATFVIKTDKIKIISWENGDVDDYEKTFSTKEVAKDSNVSKKEENVLPFIDRRGRTFYMGDGIMYNEDQLKIYLSENNLKHIWNGYINGRTQATSGGILITLGILCEIIGIAIVANPETHEANIPTGIFFVISGGILEATGIPLAIVGTIRKNIAINKYNNNYAGKPLTAYSQTMKFKVGLVNSGVGFSLNF